MNISLKCSWRLAVQALFRPPFRRTFPLLICLVIISGCSGSTEPDVPHIIGSECAPFVIVEQEHESLDGAYARAAEIIEEKKDIYCYGCGSYELSLQSISVEQNDIRFPDSTFFRVQITFDSSSIKLPQNTHYVIATDGTIYYVDGCPD